MKTLAVLLLTVATAAAQSYQIALIPKSTTHEYWKTIHAGALKAKQDLKAEGVEVTVLWDGTASEDELNGQIDIVNGLVAKRVHGIVLAPLNVRALATPVETAAKAKIPTVVIDSGLNSAAHVSFLATDNYKGGSLAARRLGILLGGKGNVILLRSQKGSASTEAREAGFLDIVKNQYPGIRVVSSDHYAGGTHESAQKAGAELLKEFGSELAGIFCPNEMSTVGMLLALREAGLAGGKVKLVGFDSSQVMISALESGDLHGMVVQNPFHMGYLGIKTMVAHLKGQPVEKLIDTGCIVVTEANLTKPEIVDLLNPPLEKYLK